MDADLDVELVACGPPLTPRAVEDAAFVDAVGAVLTDHGLVEAAVDAGLSSCCLSSRLRRNVREAAVR